MIGGELTMTRWRYTMYEQTFNFEENVIFNNHVSDSPKDYEKAVATKAKREIGRGSKHIQTYEKALKNLEEHDFVARWTTPKDNVHYSVITEKGLGFREDNKGLDIWASNKWIGLPKGFGDTLTFMLLSSWRYDRHLRTQQLEVQLNLDHLVRRFGNEWSPSDIEKRIKFLKKNGNLNGQMLSELTFSPELENGYAVNEMK